jgi:hypothetical protein
VKEMFDLSGNFKDYLHGHVKPLADTQSTEPQHPELAECTFKPTINPLSVIIDQKQNKSQMAGKIVRKSSNGIFDLKNNKDSYTSRIELMMKKA